MTNPKVLFGIFSLFLLLTNGCATSRARVDAEGKALVVRSEGDVQIFHDGAWQRAQIGNTLSQGDQTRTGSNGKVDFNLGSAGGILTLMPESLFVFEQFGPSSHNPDVSAIIDLRQGRVVGDTLQPPARKKILIRTPTGTHEIR